MVVRGAERNNEANDALCGFLRSALGGAAVSVEVTRGQKAPVKVVRAEGVEHVDGLLSAVDTAHHRLRLCMRYIK